MSGRPSFGRNKALLVAAVGAGAIIGAAGLYLYQSYEQKKLQLSREEMARKSVHLNSSKKSTSTVSRRNEKISVCSSRSGCETEDEMFSALNTDDDEDVLHDLNSDDEEMLEEVRREVSTLEEEEEKKNRETKLFAEVDLLMKGDDEDRLNAFNLFKKYEFEMSGNSVCSSRSEYETEDEMFSALNTDDDEDVFYDLNSDDEEMLEEVRREVSTLEEEEEKKNREAKIFADADRLMKGDDEERRIAFCLLKKYEFEMSENSDFLWRYAKAHQILAVMCENWKETAKKKKYVFEGLEFASKALAMDDTNPEVHKWFAILTGMQGDFVSLKQKIQNGYLFQKHIHIAIEYNPEDYFLHHLLGRFKFEIANASWVKKKMALPFFAEIPDLTYTGAIAAFLRAEELNLTPWKENRLLLARCYAGDGKYDKAIQWLDSAKEIRPKTKEDEECDREIGTLIEKYEKYRK